MALRLLLLTQWFDPEPTSKGLLFARELAMRGFDVEVVTGFPNYPGGKLYPGYRMRWFQREEIDGVRVTRLPLYPSHDHSVIGRVLNYISFAVAAAVYGLFGAARPSVLYAYHPPLTIGLVAALLRIVRRVPLVYDIQDLWPDTLRATGLIRNERILAFVGWLCRLVYRVSDRVVVQSPGFRRLLVARGVPPSKIELIYNWADETAVSASAALGAPEGFRRPGSFVVLFAGNMGTAQALEAVIEAAALLQQAGELIDFVFLGAGQRLGTLKTLAETRCLGNVQFVPAVPMSSVGSYLQAADALLVHLRQDPLFESTIPSKTQAYLAAGRPIVMAVAGDAARLIELSGGGVVARSEDAASIAAAIVRIANLSGPQRRAMGSHGRAFYLRELSASAGVDRFARLIIALSDGRPRDR